MPRRKTKKDPFAEQVGLRIKVALESAGLSIPQAAEEIGMDPNTLGGAIRGYHRVQYEPLIALSQLLNRSIEYFFGLPLPHGLGDEEDEIIHTFRAYRTPQMREALLADARRHLEIEKQLLPGADE